MQVVPSTKSQHSQKIADELGHFLADTYVLYLKTQNYHWNVTGPLFPALHKMFEEQYLELATAVDEIAERIRALGCVAPATFSQYQKLTSIKEDSTIPSAENMVKKLMKDHETLSAHAMIVLEKAEENEDQGTMDLLIQRVKAHDKFAWMLKSSL